MVRGGNLYLAAGALRRGGATGYYWANTALDSDPNALYLDFNSTNVLPSRTNDRWLGFMVWALRYLFVFVSDRKAVPTIVAVRRDDVSAIEMEGVRIELRWVGSASPVVAKAARAPQRASSHIHVPATS